MTKLFVLIGALGEYEQYTEILLGVFATREKAEAAIADSRKSYPADVQKWHDWETRRKTALERFPPTSTSYSEIYAGGVFKAYANEHYAEAENAAGPDPDIPIEYEEIKIFEVEQDQWRWGWPELHAFDKPYGNTSVAA